jgi:hypothetical protein
MPRSPTRRICQYVKRKRLLIDKMIKALTPVARVLLAALVAELRREGPAASDARLLAGLLADGVDSLPACTAILEPFGAATGLRILSHERRVVRANEREPEFILSISFGFDTWERQLREALGETLAPVLEVEMHASRNGVATSRLLSLQELELADLEQVHLVFQTYWLENLAMIATPTTGLRHGARA